MAVLAKNPIILSDYSDPDVIRVNDTYYMTASSFHFTPGLPLLVSKDLVHWNLVGYAAKNIPMPQFNEPRHSKGVWAPSLRYHNGKFIIVVGLPDEGIFVTESDNFYDGWTSLRCVRKACGFIDPCPFWDKDGKAYIVHAYAKSRIGFKSKIGIFEVNPESLDAIGEDSFIFDGEISQPTIEGPKVYFRNGFYYIAAPAGGVKQGWQTLLKANNIMGPYEEHIVLSQGKSHINGPHQGGLVDTPNGDWYFLHFQDRGVYGRVILLERAIWKDDLVFMGTEENAEPEDSFEVNLSPCSTALPGIAANEVNDDFDNGEYGLQWQWQANVKAEAYVLKRSEKGLCLLCKNADKGSLWNLPNVLSEKIVYEDFTAEIEMDISGLKEDERAGVLFLGGQYAGMEIKIIDNEPCLNYIESFTDSYDSEKRVEKSVVIKKCFIQNKDSVKFIINCNSLAPDKEKVSSGMADSECPSECCCDFSLNIDGNVIKSEKEAYKPGSDHWVGCKIAVFAQGKKGSVIVKSVKVMPKSK
ncbi:MAG: glycoside hydrolase 43 family protein [Treponema sp.]|nr:glycoside hydrolase 43 family protein [Treponema sp.]